MSDVAITEITELNADEGVHGVARAANGASFLLLKAAAPADACKTCKGKGTILEGNRDCPDCDGAAKSSSSEADEFEQEVLKQEAEWERLDKALSAADRAKMPASSFAFVDKKGGKHLPIHNKGHATAAQGRVGSQDFSEAKGDPAKAKATAESRIKAANEKFSSASKGDVQDALGGTKTPVESGHLDTGLSGLAGSVTAGAASQPPNSTLTLGGRATVAIPDESKVTDNPTAPASTDAAGILNPTAVAKGVSSLMEAMSSIEATRQAIKDGKYLQVDNPLLSQAVDPGSAPWESYDSATLAQVAQCLAGCCNALDSIAQREAVEAASGNPSDSKDSWDLEDAASALRMAMGIAARLAFSEAAEAGTASKSGRVVSDKNMKALEEAHKHLSAVLDGAKGKAGAAGEDSTIKELIHMDITQSDFISGIREVIKAERKAEKKAAKLAAEEAAKDSANNNGEVAPADIHATSEHAAEDVSSVGGAVKPEYVNKGEGDDPDPAVKAMNDQLETLTKGLASVQELVTKIAKQPRPGGPSLDGQIRVAGEGRLSDAAKGTAGDGEIDRLTKAFETETDPVLKERHAEALLQARLYERASKEFGQHKGLPNR